jgi:hypothetical protein
MENEIINMLKEINNSISQLESELMLTDEVEATAKLEVYKEMKEWFEGMIINYCEMRLKVLRL